MDRIHISNRVFNINGQGDEMLLAVLELAFNHSGVSTATAWAVSEEHGLVLFASFGVKDAALFPIPLTAEEVTPMIKAWLNDDDTWARIKLDGWDTDADHDGHNTRGWHIYCNDWGHIGESSRGFIAIKPAFMWHGK